MLVLLLLFEELPHSDAPRNNPEMMLVVDGGVAGDAAGAGGGRLTGENTADVCPARRQKGSLEDSAAPCLERNVQRQ